MGTETAAVRRGRKFDQVLEGAREVFLRDGFEGANVDDIARAAGRGIGDGGGQGIDAHGAPVEFFDERAKHHVVRVVQAQLVDLQPG